LVMAKAKVSVLTMPPPPNNGDDCTQPQLSNGPETTAGLPELSPDEHNQVVGRSYNKWFAAYGSGAAEEESKRGSAFQTRYTNLFEKCNVHVCTTHGQLIGSSTRCECSGYKIREDPIDASVAHTCSQYAVEVRVLGRSNLNNKRCGSQ